MDGWWPAIGLRATVTVRDRVTVRDTVRDTVRYRAGCRVGTG